MAVLGGAAVSHERGTDLHDLSIGPPQTQPRWRCTHGDLVGDDIGLLLCPYVTFYHSEPKVFQSVFYCACSPDRPVPEASLLPSFLGSLLHVKKKQSLLAG